MGVLAIASSLVARIQLARLNTVVLTSEALADLTCSPLIWRIWSIGLSVGGRALGLPWFVVAFAYFLVSIVLWSLTFDKDPTEHNEIPEPHID
jgi:hypothetical protein